MDPEDTLYPGPSEPAADPRVRAFADQALVEIRTVARGNTNGLSDKEAFSEYMYKLNESALLDLNSPPPVTAVVSLDQSNQTDHGRRETSSEDQTAEGITKKTLETNEKQCCRCMPSIVSPVPNGSSIKMKRYYGKDDARVAGTALQQGGGPFQRDGGAMKTVRFDTGHPGDYLFQGRIQAGDPKESSDFGSTEASDDELLSPCDLEGRDLLEELRRWRQRASHDIEGRANMHRQSSRVAQSLQPPPPPLHSASSRSLSSSTPRRMKPRKQENPRGSSIAGVPGVFPPSLPRSQPTEESPFCGRQEPGFLEAGQALTKNINNNDTRCGGAEHDEIVDTPFQFAWGRKGKIPGVDKPEPKEFVTKGVSCHVGDRGRREGFQGGNMGCDGEEESCEELSLDLSNCSEEKLGHLRKTWHRRGGGRA